MAKAGIENFAKEVAIKKAMIIAKCQSDPNAFLEYCFQDPATNEFIKQQKFHREWQEAISNFNSVMILAPRNHGKTVQIVGRLIWEMGRNPNIRIKLACQNDDKAAERCQLIAENILYNERVHDIFPNMVRGKTKGWNMHKITIDRNILSKDATLEAIGILGSATGGRADLILFDDIIDQRNALLQPAMREQIKQAYRAVWVNMLEPGGRKMYIATPWHEKDLTSELVKQSDYKVLQYPIVKDFEGKWKSIWPDKWGHEQLEQQRIAISDREFARAFELKVISDGEILFPADVMKLYNTVIDYDNLPATSEMNIVLGVDANGGSKDLQRGDYFAIVTLGYTATRIFVLDIYREKIGFDKHVKAVLKQLDRGQRWGAVQSIRFEDNSYQESLRREVADKCNTPCIGKKYFTDKVSCAAKMSNLWNSGKIFLYDGAMHFDDLIEELCAFPLSSHDDMVDALVRAGEGIPALGMDQVEAGMLLPDLRSKTAKRLSQSDETEFGFFEAHSHNEEDFELRTPFDEASIYGEENEEYQEV